MPYLRDKHTIYRIAMASTYPLTECVQFGVLYLSFSFFLTCVTALFFDLVEEAACYVCKCLIMLRRYEGDTRETINTRKCAKNLHVAWGVGVLFWTKTETKSILAVQVTFTLFLSSANHSPRRTELVFAASSSRCVLRGVDFSARLSQGKTENRKTEDRDYSLERHAEGGAIYFRARGNINSIAISGAHGLLFTNHEYKTRTKRSRTSAVIFTINQNVPTDLEL